MFSGFESAIDRPCTNRVVAIYQIMLGWKTWKCYYETDELPNPRQTQPQEKVGYISGIWATFFATANNFLVGWD